MKPTEMPARRLTADCILNSFQSSGKRHLILTGSRESGKTTMLLGLFPQALPGLTTWAQPKKAVYLKDNLSGETAQIGAYDPLSSGVENRMIIVEDGFTASGIPALARIMESESEWITIDEIGYLESGCDAYKDAIRDLFDKKRVAAVIRKQDIPFLNELVCREDAFVVDLDDPFGNIGCVIMASGLGKRFGANKLMADFHGSPMICRILDATEGIFSHRVVVTRYVEIAELCKKRGIETVLHDLPYRSDTVRLGLEAMPCVERCMFAAADQPLLRRETVESLALASKNCPDLIWRVCWEGTPGTPAVFPKWAFEELLQLPEGKGGGAVIKKYPERIRTVNARDMYELKDVDSHEDLTKLLEQ